MSNVNKTTKIKIDGKNYNVDIEKAIKDGYLKPDAIHVRGNIYKHIDTGEYYILAYVGNSNYCLVNLTNGMCWDDAYEVDDRDADGPNSDEWDDMDGQKFLFVGHELNIDPQKIK